MSRLPDGLYFDLVNPDEISAAYELEAAGNYFVLILIYSYFLA